MDTKFSDRRGRLCIIPPVSKHQCPSAVKNAREASLAIRGPRLYNSLPKYLRNITGVSVESFKRRLDKYLLQLPDEPSVDGYYGMRSSNSNSIIDIQPQMRATTSSDELQDVNPAEVENP